MDTPTWRPTPKTSFVAFWLMLFWKVPWWDVENNSLSATTPEVATLLPWILWSGFRPFITSERSTQLTDSNGSPIPHPWMSFGKQGGGNSPLRSLEARRWGADLIRSGTVENWHSFHQKKHEYLMGTLSAWAEATLPIQTVPIPPEPPCIWFQLCHTCVGRETGKSSQLALRRTNLHSQRATFVKRGMCMQSWPFRCL